MKNGLVSIIMPSYNTGDYILESIKSVQNQSYSNWELIIIDDCSTDNTITKIETVLDDNRIKFIRKNSNGGAAESRNLGLRNAKGKWIAFLDSDDLWDKYKLEKQINFMENNDYHFSYTNYFEFTDSVNKCSSLITGPRKINEYNMKKYCWMGCLTVMYDADYVGLVQIKNIRKNNDYALWLKIIKKANCYLLDESLGFYRKGRTGSISNANYLKLVKWHYRLFKENENYNSALSMFYTFRNLFFGMYKKIVYKKAIK